MSAIKTHEVFHIVTGDDITFQNEEGVAQILQVKSLMVSRQQPSICQIFTEKENAGSMSRQTKVFHARIEAIHPGDNSTDFAVRAKVNNIFHDLKLTTVRSESSECSIC